MIIVNALVTNIILRFQNCAFPLLQLLFNFVCVHNVHALISVMEMVAAAQNAQAIVVSLQLCL